MAAGKRPSIHYAWIVAAVVFLAGLGSAGVRASPAVYIVPLGDEFGWTRGQLGAVIAMNLALFGVAAPISGRLIDRFGPRLVMIGSLALLGVGAADTIFVTQLWQLALLWGPFLGLGAGGGASVVAVSIATRWFVRRRGFALGLLSSASSTGQILFIPLLGVLIASFSWRTASLALACITVAILLCVALWVRNQPADVGLEPYGADASEASKPKERDGPSVGLLSALRTPEFWLLAGTLSVCGGTSSGLVGTHFIPNSIDHGIPPETAAMTYGVMGGVNIAGTLFSGWLSDRVDPRKILAAVYALRGLSLLVLPGVTDTSGLLIFAVIYGLDWFASVPPTVTLVVRRFGRQSLGTIYGCIFFAHQLGAATMAFGGGQVHDLLGDYRLAFMAGGVIAMVGAGMAMRIRVPRLGPPALAPALVRA